MLLFPVTKKEGGNEYHIGGTDDNLKLSKQV